jgi:hypothetical protein
MEYMAGTDPDSSTPAASFHYVMIRILHSTSQETVPIGESNGSKRQIRRYPSTLRILHPPTRSAGAKVFPFRSPGSKGAKQ